jgi:hypothetical protein
VRYLGKLTYIGIALVIVLTPAAIVSADPVVTLPLPELGLLDVTGIHEEAFDSLDAWENYHSASGVSLGVESGIYRAYTPTSGYVWGINAHQHENVVVEVDVTPLTIFTDNGAGVMCRANPESNGDGYYFMISAEGYYSIRVGQGDGIRPLVDWEASDAIRTGIDSNTIRAVCIDNALAMYVNGQLVAYLQDMTYTSGTAGLAVAGGTYGVDMAFDDVTIYNIASEQLLVANLP